MSRFFRNRRFSARNFHSLTPSAVVSQTLGVSTFVLVDLGDAASNRPAGRLELLSQRLGRAPRSGQIDHLPAKFCGI